MIGLYIFGGLFVVGIGAFIFYKVKWSNERRAEERGRVKIE